MRDLPHRPGRPHPLLLLALGAGLACSDNPFGRPATVVDGSGFPPEVRGAIRPTLGHSGGQRAFYYLLGPVTPALGEALLLVDPDGTPLPDCRSGQRDDSGVLREAALDACQGAILPALPGQDGYSPFLRVVEVTVPAGYQLNAIRGRREAEAAALPRTTRDSYVDLTVIDPAASIVDSTGTVHRLVGWMDTLELVYLSLSPPRPLVDGSIPAMDLLVPEGMQPGSGGDVLPARAGMPGYSTLCRLVHYATPPGFTPGDITDAAQIPDADRRISDPPSYVHCALP
jgi:hypothetical protein